MKGSGCGAWLLPPPPEKRTNERTNDGAEIEITIIGWLCF
jgi:hypothetical protein